MMKKAIMIMGMIGSGKDTQSDFLAERLGLDRFRTSKLLEEEFARVKPEDKDYDFIMGQHKIYLEGILNDPEWVTGLVIKRVQQSAKSNFPGLVLSSSPRTMFEADRLVPEMEKLYGKENVIVFRINIGLEEALRRNTDRRVCEANLHPINPELLAKKITTCPLDGSKIITREGLDSPEIIVNARYPEYINRTKPIFESLKNRGIHMIDIEGERSISEVSQQILTHLTSHDFNQNITTN